MKYVKYMPYRSIIHASRNKRELLTAGEYGFETVVFSNDQTLEHAALPKECELIWDGTRILNRRIPKWKRLFLIAVNHLHVIGRTLRLPGGVWSCHDLSSLRLAWLVTRLRFDRPTLIYDSHEFELGRNAKRNRIQRFFVKKWEGFLMKRCAFSIVVNDSIADEVQRIHQLRERPVVVRSAPDNWSLEPDVIRSVRETIEDMFHV